ncbi:MAG: tRNA (adenosine(37)-N6)-threonylcarbamoyltransferase complex ATPase subunit type 1 TsaE [Candidatus Parcubacteria bacterium]|nr:tRNA (adenosine(37)-N6)-threonylcarbamoyltransferase complex ATPase subunit type 1 TsaE [Candidatus Parcubacteria bacterium]
MKEEYFTIGVAQTKKLGVSLAKRILKRPIQKRAVVLGLKGELGEGKTAFLQGFAKGLGIKERVLSPTFVIMKKFKIKKKKFRNFFHIDCYRIREKDIMELGFKEIASEPKNIIAIEWAGRIKRIIPKDAIWLKFKSVAKNKRKIQINI